MKRLLPLFLVLALCLGLGACGTETPEPTPTPEASAAPVNPPAAEQPLPEDETPTDRVEVEVSDRLCDAGRFTDEYGNSVCYSYVLPQLDGASGEYIDKVNAEIGRIYEDAYLSAKANMDEGIYPGCDRIGYRFAENGDVCSLLLYVVYDYGSTEYRCFNFFHDGTEAENENLFDAALISEDDFLAAVRGKLEEMTDFSGWDDMPEDFEEIAADVRDRTLDESNCNADIPVFLDADGNLRFIARVYSLAGADCYDHEFAILPDGTVKQFDEDYTFIQNVTGCYAIPDDTDEETEYLLNLYEVGDALMGEMTYRMTDGSVFSYWGVSFYPEDPAELFESGRDSCRMKIWQYYPAVMGGSYGEEPGEYTLNITDTGISLTDFGGGEPLLGHDGDLYFDLTFDYEDDTFLYEPNAEFDWETAASSGLCGAWCGSYYDREYNMHTLSLEIESYGVMLLRDMSDAGVPRVLAGNFAIAGNEDGAFAPGTFCYALSERGNYKMPIVGFCDMWIEDGALCIAKQPDDWGDEMLYIGMDDVVRLYPMGYACGIGEKDIEAFDGETACDLDGDGVAETISVRLAECGDYAYDAICVVCGDNAADTEAWFYESQAYLVRNGTPGEAFVYLDIVSDNDYHALEVFRVTKDACTYSGSFFGGFAETPEDPDDLCLETVIQYLTTVFGEKHYRLSACGLPEPTDGDFLIPYERTLTVKQPFEGTSMGNGEAYGDSAAFEPGETLRLIKTDGKDYFDVRDEAGSLFRLWINAWEWPQTINDVPVEELLDGIVFAG